jgi:hypothetical protein
MPRLSTTANGAVRRRTPGAQPAGRRLPPAESLGPPPQAPQPSTAVDGAEDTVYEDVEDFVDAAVPAEARAPQRNATAAIAQVVEAVGPNGETLTLELGDDGRYHTVSTNIPPPPVSAEVEHPLLQTLRSRTAQPSKQARRLPAYNNPMLWYMKRDGEVVQLQGDPGNRAYYEEKGFVVLRQEEVDAYLKDRTRTVPDGRGGFKREVLQPAVRRLVLQEQRRRAELITTIRNVASRNATVEIAGDLSLTPTDELDQLLQQLKSNQSINFTLLQARQRDKADEFLDDDLTTGVELASGVELERKLAAYAQSQDSLVHTGRLNPALPDH